MACKKKKTILLLLLRKTPVDFFRGKVFHLPLQKFILVTKKQKSAKRFMVSEFFVLIEMHKKGCQPKNSGFPPKWMVYNGSKPY